jgi:hypothetical protein
MLNIPHSKAIGKGMVAQVERGQTKNKKEKILALFDKAVAAFEERQQWPISHCVNLFNGYRRGKKVIIFLRNAGEIINLHFWQEGGPEVAPFKIGYLHPLKGWIGSREATHENYLTWNKKVRVAIWGKEEAHYQ